MYNLIQEKHRKKPLNSIFFPMYDVLHSPLVKIVGANACPTVTATPETVKAAFTKENDVFAENNVKYIDPVLNFADRKLFALPDAAGMADATWFLAGRKRASVSKQDLRRSRTMKTDITARARQTLDQLEREDRIGIVMLARPYHHDPGLNHEILDEFQKLGYPIFSQNTLPHDEDLLDRLFGEEVRAGVITVRWILRMPGRIRIPAARITRCGQRSLRRGIRIWWRWRFPASNAGTMRRFMALSKASSRSPERRTSASRISTKTSQQDRSDSSRDDRLLPAALSRRSDSQAQSERRH